MSFFPTLIRLRDENYGKTLLAAVWLDGVANQITHE